MWPQLLLLVQRSGGLLPFYIILAPCTPLRASPSACSNEQGHLCAMSNRVVWTRQILDRRELLPIDPWQTTRQQCTEWHLRLQWLDWSRLYYNLFPSKHYGKKWSISPCCKHRNLYVFRQAVACIHNGLGAAITYLLTATVDITGHQSHTWWLQLLT